MPDIFQFKNQCSWEWFLHLYSSPVPFLYIIGFVRLTKFHPFHGFKYVITYLITILIPPPQILPKIQIYMINCPYCL